MIIKIKNIKIKLIIKKIQKKLKYTYVNSYLYINSSLYVLYFKDYKYLRCTMFLLC